MTTGLLIEERVRVDEDATSPAREEEEAVGIAKRGVCEIGGDCTAARAGEGAATGALTEEVKRLNVDFRKEEVEDERLPECFARRATRTSQLGHSLRNRDKVNVTHVQQTYSVSSPS